MITLIELKEIIKNYLNTVDVINLDTFNDYIHKCNYSLYVHQHNFNKIKGDIFESVCKYYLLNGGYETYLFNDIPIHLKDKLNIGKVDKGIDMIFQCDEKWYGVQCKWRSQIDLPINKNDVAGFYFEFKKTNLDIPLMMTNVNKPTGYFGNSGIKWITKNILQKSIDQNFFDYIVNDDVYIDAVAERPIEQLRYYQQEALDKLRESNDKNKQCILARGAGKGVIAIKYSENFNKVVIFMPSLQLISQFYKKLIVNTKRKILCICSDLDRQGFVHDEANDKLGEQIMDEFIAEDAYVQYTTTPKEISIALQYKKPMIVLCTYHSSKLLQGKTFDLGIFDEAHKTVGDGIFSFALSDKNVKINERVYMTATPKYYVGNNNAVVSMNKEEIYGKVIYEYPFTKAIADNFILDFEVVMYSVPENMEDIIFEKYIKNGEIKVKSEIIISAILLAEHLKTNVNCTKILTYHNSIRNVNDFKKTLYYIFEKLGINANIYSLSGSTRMKTRRKIFDEFTLSNGINIICSAKVLNEGVDIPCVNGVMFVDSRESTIDIIQSVGRGLQLYGDQIKCSVIIPVHYDKIMNHVNYPGIIRILSAMSDVDDKLIENFIMKNANNKIVVKSVGVVSELYSENDVKYDVDALYEKFKTVICDSQKFCMEYNKLLLFAYCDEFGRVPKGIEIYNGKKLGGYYQDQKKKIDNIDSFMYKQLSGNELVKNNLDKYLQYLQKNANKPKLSDDQMRELLFDYCKTDECALRQDTEHEGVNIGSWLEIQKKKITNIENPLYKMLSINPHVKKNIDKKLQYTQKHKNVPSIEFKEWITLLFEYCDDNQSVPLNSANYKGQNIGAWLQSQKGKINSVEDELYKVLQDNNYVKTSLDDYLKKTELNKDKPKHEWETIKTYLFDYCDENESVPTRDIICNGINIYTWLGSQKGKISSSEDELYKKLKMNKYVEENLNKYLKYLEENKDKITLSQKEWIEMLFKCCNDNNKMIISTFEYTDESGNLHKIGGWFSDQKKKIKNKECVLYKLLSKNLHVKINLDNFLENKEKNKDNKKLSKDELCELLFKYCNDNDGKIPSQKTSVNDPVSGVQNIGNFYDIKKRKITETSDPMYIKLCTNPHIKRNLDEYLESINDKRANRPIKLSHDQKILLLFSYCDEHKEVPKKISVHKGHKIGWWYQQIRRTVTGIEDPLYKELQKNEYTKINLDDFLANKFV